MRGSCRGRAVHRSCVNMFAERRWMDSELRVRRSWCATFALTWPFNRMKSMTRRENSVGFSRYMRWPTPAMTTRRAFGMPASPRWRRNGRAHPECPHRRRQSVSGRGSPAILGAPVCRAADAPHESCPAGSRGAALADAVVRHRGRVQSDTGLVTTPRSLLPHHHVREARMHDARVRESAANRACHSRPDPRAPAVRPSRGRQA
jgi:hypothetical protein